MAPRAQCIQIHKCPINSKIITITLMTSIKQSHPISDINVQGLIKQLSNSSNCWVITLHTPNAIVSLFKKKRRRKKEKIPICWAISSTNICYSVWRKSSRNHKMKGRKGLTADTSLQPTGLHVCAMCDVWSVMAQACDTHIIMGSLLLSQTNAKLWTMTTTLSQVSFLKYDHFCFKEEKKNREKKK